MTLFAAADLLADFQFFANRTSTDASMSTTEIYRLLTLAQQDVTSDIAAVFPRLMMGAPALMVTADSGLTYTISGTDEDGESPTPYGHAEVYLAATGGVELYGSSYGGGWGDIVFEGNRVRIPRGLTRSITGGPYIRYVAMPGTLNASNEPTLKPPPARRLIVYRALTLWAARGGQRDPRPYIEMYATTWNGTGLPGSNGLLGLLHTQYSRSTDAALEGVKWWRAYTAQGGSAGWASLPGVE